MKVGSYEAAGVSIERGEKAADLMRSAVEATHGPEVLGGAGSFAGLYALAGYKDPVLASTIDGVGTKVLVAKALDRYDSLGADIVNHCANDVLAVGSRPDRKSTRLNSSHANISYAVFCLKKKK